MKPGSSFGLTALMLALPCTGVVGAEWHVWTLAETRHVLRSDPPAAGTTVKLGAARNEWVSFQILLRSDAPVNGIGLDACDLKGPGGAILPSAGARLYRQHQLHLETGTYRNDAFKADWYPDPLIPFLNPVTGKQLEGARIKAVPFDLPANETHGFWVDLYVPADAVPGEYRGVYRVTAAGGKAAEVPISLTVWNFALPQTPTLVTEFGSPRLRDYYRRRAQAANLPEPSDWTAVETQCARMLSEHRFNATPPRATLTPKAQPDGSFQIPSSQVGALREFVDRYHVNALQTPHPSSAVKDPAAQRDTLQAWLAAFDRAAKALDRPGVLFYTYLRDEPNTLEDYRYVQKWGRAVRDAKSVVKVLVVEQPWTEPGQGGADSAWGDLYGAVDVWCPLFSLHRQESAAKRQALGETIWTYTALCQGPPTPWWHIDFPLLNYRVPAWMAWRDGMKGLLYWGGMSYWNRTEDPWTQAPFYTGNDKPQQGRKGIVFQGEGSLVYPAHDVGYDGIVPTIRLKALRDAIEDYEYLAILQRLGKTAEAQNIVRSLTESFFQWNKDPAAYEQARAQLATMIVAASSPPLREENFDSEPPDWEGSNNRGTPFEPKMVTQNFGYSQKTSHTGAQPGEVGGTINPAAEAAYYGYRLPKPLTLNDPINASGRMLVRRGPGHFLLGFFDPATLNEWRTPNTLAARINGRGEGYHCHVEYCTSRWRAGAGVIGEIVPGRRIDAKLIPGDRVYDWRLSYEPDESAGTGRLTFTLNNQTGACVVLKEHRVEGATFTHFGLVPVLKSWDNPGEVWINDVTVGGRHFDLRQDPGWEGADNRTTYQTKNVRPRFDFGWSPTHWADGKAAGELGGLIFRGDCRDPHRLAAYGARLAPLTLDTPLFARGKLSMIRGVSDSTASIGFYHSKWSLHSNPAQDQALPMDYLGINIEGPSSEGFFFYPVCRAHGETAQGHAGASGPRLRLYPDRSAHEWSLTYDPQGSDGKGQITVSLDGQTCTLNLRSEDRSTGASFDRFGICTPWIDGNSVTVFFDDLQYTAGPAEGPAK